jgi:guanylate kinase
VGSAGPVLVVLTGPSGAGKDSIIERLKTLLPAAHYAITATDRAPRPEERDGVDYYFVTTDRFEEMLREGELLEHARVYEQWKGVPRAQVREAVAAGKDVILRTDVQGARYIASQLPGTVTIFVGPPSDEELERRLRTRGGDSDEQVALRLNIAREEMDDAGDFDFAVINRDLDETAAEVVEIIERARKDPARPATAV